MHCWKSKAYPSSYSASISPAGPSPPLPCSSVKSWILSLWYVSYRTSPASDFCYSADTQITYLGVASLDLLIIVLYFTLGHSDAPPHSISNLPPASGPRSRLSMLQTQGAQMEVQADSPVSSKWALTPSTGTLVEGFTPMTGRSEKRFFP